MVSKADFTPEEWKTVLSSPMLASMAVTLAEPSGLWGILKEGMASGRALLDASNDANASGIAKAIVADIGDAAGRTDAREAMKAQFSGKSPEEMSARSCSGCRRPRGSSTRRLRPRLPPSRRGLSILPQSGRSLQRRRLFGVWGREGIGRRESLDRRRRAGAGLTDPGSELRPARLRDQPPAPICGSGKPKVLWTDRPAVRLAVQPSSIAIFASASSIRPRMTDRGRRDDAVIVAEDEIARMDAHAADPAGRVPPRRRPPSADRAASHGARRPKNRPSRRASRRHGSHRRRRSRARPARNWPPRISPIIAVPASPAAAMTRISPASMQSSA